MPENKKIALIIGAGPAGLTAAHELIERTDYTPLVVEASDMVGGISRTVVYKGNRMDIGGHRFFSKSDRVMNWWLSFLPLEALDSEDKLRIRYHQKEYQMSAVEPGLDPENTDEVMLVRKRLSRIFYLRKFFDYPIRLNKTTLLNLGIVRMIRITLSYVRARFFPIKQEKNLEDFFINRFGRVLYETFFRDYTEKVWGVPCSQIEPEWGSQRIKGLSVSKAIWHALRSIVPKDSGDQKNIETSLIDRFLYPKFGPGQLWEVVRNQVLAKGGQIMMNHRVVEIHHKDSVIRSVTIVNSETGGKKTIKADLFFSTMPVKDLIAGFSPPAPVEVADLANGLIYRDFIAVGILLDKMYVKTKTEKKPGVVPDNWIYVQDSDVRVGRIQVFNNWSPFMVADQNKVWLGLEYFCNEGDAMWKMSNEAIVKLGIDELIKIGLAESDDFLDGIVVRMPKTYPAYFGSYDRFGEIQRYTDQFLNLFLIGRNGMHKYNNQDHSMLTAMTAVDNIVSGIESRANIWAVNTEEDYHEEES